MSHEFKPGQKVRVIGYSEGTALPDPTLLPIGSVHIVDKHGKLPGGWDTDQSYACHILGAALPWRARPVGSACPTEKGPCDGNHPPAVLQHHAAEPYSPPFPAGMLTVGLAQGVYGTATDDSLQQLVSTVANAARKLAEAGFSGELRVAHGSLRVAP